VTDADWTRVAQYRDHSRRIMKAVIKFSVRGESDNLLTNLVFINFAGNKAVFVWHVIWRSVMVKLSLFTYSWPLPPLAIHQRSFEIRKLH
jgi:hypothetical protein